MKSSLLLLCAALSGSAIIIAAPVKHPSYEPDGKAVAPAVEALTQTPRLIPVSARVRYDRDVFTSIPVTKTPSTLSLREADGETCAVTCADDMPVVKLRGWRGERVQAQVLVESPQGFAELRIAPCTLWDGNSMKPLFGAEPAVPVQVDVVRYTLADGVLRADILDGTAQTQFKGVVRPLMLTVDIPEDTDAKTLCGLQTILVNGTKLQLRVEVTIDDMTLPPPSEWQVHLDLWQHPDVVARWHDVPMWSPEHLALLKPTMKRLADMGQKTITTTLIDEAWNAQVYDRFRSMVQVTKTSDGDWQYDFSNFITWVTFMREEVGMEDARIHCYTMIPWSLTFPYTDEATGTTVAQKLQPGTEAYELYWGRFLCAFVTMLDEHGWLEQTRIAMDERPDYLLKPALEVLHKYAPMLKIVAACDRPSELNRNFDDVSYAYGICEQLVPVAAERRAEDKKTTYYVCLHPDRPNTFMASDLAESEWLLPMAANYGMDGILRWAYQSWVENPLVSQDYTAFPSGDTSLVYPGNRSSLRLEALRNGIETFEKIHILRARAAEEDNPDALKPLEEALKTFTVKRGYEVGIHLQDLEVLDKALEETTDALTR